MLNRLRTLPGQLTAVGYGLALSVAITSLTWRLGNDQALFTFVGQTILDGGVPYRDAWEVKWPLTHYVYALALAIWTQPGISIRILDLILILSFSWLLRKFLLRLSGGNIFSANCAVIFFLLAYYSLGFWHTAQPDGWGAMLMFIIVLMLAYPSSQPNWIMGASGGLIALATLLKPTFVVFLALPLLFPARETSNGTYKLSPLFTCLLSFVTVISASLVFLSQLSGGLEDFLDVHRFIFLSYLPARKHIDVATFILNFHSFLIPFLLASFGIWLQHRKGMGRQARLMATWLIVALLIVVIQGRYYLYHWIPALTAAAPSFGIALGEFQCRSPSAASRRSLVLTLLVFIFALAPLSLKILRPSNDWPAGKLEYRLSAYIIDRSDPHDRVLMWGELVGVYMLSNHKSPTRFATSLPLVTPSPVQVKYRKLFMDEISDRPPRYIIVDSERWLFKHAKSGLELLQDFPEFNQFLHSRYMLEGNVDAFQFWRLND